MLGLANLGPSLLIAAVLWAAVMPGNSRPDDASCLPGASIDLEIAATTDVHGHIRGWDYFENRPDSALGLARAATIVDSVRAANPGRVLLVDAGDLLQGTPLTYLASRHPASSRNPIIAAMNVMHYDAAVIGNHEFNYGVRYLNGAVSQAHFPMLAANVGRTGDAHPYRAFTIVHREGVAVGIVGATTPGSNLWDASNLSKAHMRVGDIVPAVWAGVAAARVGGADVIVVLLHSGLDEPSSYDTATTGVASENVAARVAREIPGINVVVYGHSHRENPGVVIGQTLLVQPKNWAASVAIATVRATCATTSKWAPSSPATAVLVQSAGHAENVAVVRAVQTAHAATLSYVNSAIGTTPDTWRSDSARMEPTGITGFILEVERRAANADIASTAAFDLRAHLGPGPITVAELAQLYPYENTLRAIRITGAQLRAYIEYSNRYYQTSADRQLIPDTAVAGYNFDVVSGVDYRVDVSRPVGDRVVSLRYHGKDVTPTETFTMALNNYRQSGGGGYSMLSGAPVVYDRQQDIRQLLIDEVTRLHEIRQSNYTLNNWSFVKPDAGH
ncbi:MAG: 5'-nucleotidase C-terminal domain-containing protein [Gemmatimonadaceae bacterium]